MSADPFVTFKSRAALARERFAIIHAARMAQICTPPNMSTPVASPDLRASASPKLDVLPVPSPKIEANGAPQPNVELSPGLTRSAGCSPLEDIDSVTTSSPSMRHRHTHGNVRGDIDKITITVGQASGIDPMPPKVLRPLTAGKRPEPVPELSPIEKEIEKQAAEDKEFDKTLDELLGWLYAMKDDYPKWGCKEAIDLLSHSKDEYELLKFHREQMSVHSAKVAKDIVARLKKK